MVSNIIKLEDASPYVVVPKVNVAGAEELDFSKILEMAQRAALRNQVSGVPNNLEDIFQRAAKQYNVPAELLKAVGKAESDFRPYAVSRAGAMGIMQLMPATVKEYGITDPFDPEQSIMGGARELSEKLKLYNGDLKLALAAYNAGSGNVRKYGGVPPFKETQNYIVKIYRYLEEGVTVPGAKLSIGASTNANAKPSIGASTNANAKPSIGASANTNAKPSIVTSANTNTNTTTSQSTSVKNDGVKEIESVYSGVSNNTRVLTAKERELAQIAQLMEALKQMGVDESLWTLLQKPGF